MLKLVILYKRNIYGVIGTLVFHILLVSVFLLAEIERKTDMRESEILVEIPFELPEEMIEEQMIQQPSAVAELRTNQASSSSVPAGRTATSERFFDADYQAEIDRARRLVDDVNQQLAREIPDMSKVQMPEQVNENNHPDSLRQMIYTGDSNIEYNLTNRYHLRLPIPIYLTRGGGTVIVDISVNRQGRVVNAQPRSSASVSDELIFLYAREAALRTLFNADPTAPVQQQGTIRYTFIPQ